MDPFQNPIRFTPPPLPGVQVGERMDENEGWPQFDGVIAQAVHAGGKVHLQIRHLLLQERELTLASRDEKRRKGYPQRALPITRKFVQKGKGLLQKLQVFVTRAERLGTTTAKKHRKAWARYYVLERKLKGGPGEKIRYVELHRANRAIHDFSERETQAVLRQGQDAQQRLSPLLRDCDGFLQDAAVLHQTNLAQGFYGHEGRT